MTLWQLIPDKYRKGVVKSAALVPVKAILDLMGVAALVPVMMMVLDTEKLHSSTMGELFELSPFESQEAFAIFIILATIAFLVVKMILCIWINKSQNKTLLAVYRTLSSNLFVTLYSRGLLYIKSHNSSRMTFNVISLCYNFVVGYLGAWMRLVGELVFTLLVILMLAVLSPKATLFAAVAFAPVVLIYLFFIRKPLKEYNRLENETRREQHRLINEAFKGYSEVHVNDVFPIIQSRFKEGLNKISSYRIRSSVIQSFSSYVLELSVVLLLAVFLLLNILGGMQLDLVFMGIFSVVLLKLLPSMRSILSSISAINATAYTRDIVSEIGTDTRFKLLHEKEYVPMEFNDCIELRDLSFTFPDDDVPIIEHMNLCIRKGERLGIKGRTGAGKTTLFNLLLGLYPPSGGGVYVDGTKIDAENVGSWHKIVGYVPQDVYIADASLLENVALGCEESQVDREKVWAVLRSASLEEFAASLPDGLDTRIGEAGSRLSGGQRQRIGIARALYKDAKVLFFDEATSALDSLTEMEINEAIRKLSEEDRELTLVVISHRDSTIELCDRTIEL